MESQIEKERPGISLERATAKDVNIYIALEKSLGKTKTYSTITDPEEALKEINNSIVYLIKKGDQIVGHVAYEIKDQEHAYISSLLIDPKYQGQGLAKEALRKILEELNNFHRIDLVTHPQNTAAIAIYESFNFKTEVVLANYFGDGEPRVRLALVK